MLHVSRLIKQGGNLIFVPVEYMKPDILENGREIGYYIGLVQEMVLEFMRG